MIIPWFSVLYNIKSMVEFQKVTAVTSGAVALQNFKIFI